MDTTADSGVPGVLHVAARPLAQRLMTSQRLRNNVYILAANLLGALCGYLLQTLLAHRLGLGAYGAIASLLAVAAAMLIPTQVIGTIVARYGAVLSGAERLAELNDLIRRLTILLWGVGVVIAALVALGSNALATFLHLGSAEGVIIIGAMFGLSFVTPVNIGALQGLQRFSWYAVLIALPQVLRFVLAGTLVVLGFGIGGAMMGILLGVFLSYLLSFKPLASLLSGPRHYSGSLRALGSYSVTATITLTMVVALSNFDTPLAKHFLSPRDAGLYAGMALLGKILLIVSNSIVMIMFPRFAALHSRGERATRAVLEAMLSVAVPCLILEAAYYLLPTLLVGTLFGVSFIAVADQLALYGLAMLLLGLTQVLIYYFLAFDNGLFMIVLLGSGGLQGLLFAARHQTVGQLVQASFVANALLFGALCALFVVSLRPARRSIPQGSTP